MSPTIEEKHFEKWLSQDEMSKWYVNNKIGLTIIVIVFLLLVVRIK